MMDEAPSYDLAAIRDRLLAAFTAETFGQLFFYARNPALRAIRNRFATGDGLEAMVGKALETCEKADLLPDLLREVERVRADRGTSVEEPSRFATLTTEIPFQVPRLSDQYVERPAELDRLKELLLPRDRGEPPPVACAVLYGIAAVGKSVLATAFARDMAVRAAFPDGVLWVTLGTRPNLPQRLADWGRALGDPSVVRGAYADETAGTSQLRTWLDRKACLLVVDDVWCRDQVRPFLVGGPNCLLLVTSRMRDVVPGAAEIPLDVMRQEEALGLMANWAGEIAERDRPMAAWLADELGYLPLALELIAAQVRRLGSWARVRQRWEEEKLAAVRRGRHPTEKEDSLLISLELSLDALDRADREPYLQLGVLAEDTAFPVSAAAALWDWDEFDAEEFLIDLAGKALLTPRSVDGEPCYTFHDVLHDFVAERLGEEGRRQAHAALVTGYRERCGGAWAELRPDGYVHDHLTMHMAAAGLRDPLYALVDKRWMDAQLARTYSHRAFALDLDRAIQVAAAEEPRNWVQWVRCSLMYTTLGSLASSVPPEVLGVLADAGQVQRAEGYAALIQDAENRSRALRLISEALLKQERAEEARIALQQALAAAAAIGDPGTKDSALGEVALAFAGLGDLDWARLIVQAIEDEEVFMTTMVALARVFVQARPVEQAALEAAAQAFRPVEIEEEEEEEAGGEEEEQEGWPIDLGMLVAALTQAGEYDEVLELAGVLDSQDKAFVYSDVARALTQAQEYDRAVLVAEQARDWAGAIEDQGLQVLLLHQVAQVEASVGRMDAAVALAEEAATITRTIEEEETRASALIQVILAFAGAGAFDRVEQTVEAIPDDWEKARILSEVAHVFAQAGDRKRVESAAAKADALTEMAVMEMRASILCPIAQALILVGAEAQARELCRQALATTEEIQILEIQGEILHMVTDALAEAGAIDLAFEMAETATTGWLKASATRPILQALIANRDFAQAQAVAEALEDEEDRSVALSQLAEGLGQAGELERAVAVAEQALQLAQVAGGERAKAELLGRWAQLLSGLHQDTRAAIVADNALRAARMISDEYERAFALCEVVQALALIGDLNRLMVTGKQAIALADEMAQDPTFAVRRIAQVMDWLGVRRFSGPAGPPAAKAILEAVVRALLRAGAFEHVLDAVESVRNEWEKAGAAGQMLEALWQGAEREKVVEITQDAVARARTFSDEPSRVYLLMLAITALVEVGDLEGARAVTQAGESEWGRAVLLRWEAGALAGKNVSERALAALDQALALNERGEDERRKVLLLSDAAQLLVDLGETERATQIAQQALAVARDIEDPATQASTLATVLAALAAAGAEEKVIAVTGEALDMLGGLEDRHTEVTFLASLLRAVAELEDRESVGAVVNRLLTILDTSEQWIDPEEVLSNVIWALVLVEDLARAQEIFASRWVREEGVAADPVLNVLQELTDAEDFGLALSVVGILREDADRMVALHQIGRALAGAADPGTAGAFIGRVWEMAEPLEDASFQVDLLIEVAKILNRAGENEAAAEFVQRALGTAGTLEDGVPKAEALAELAQLLAQVARPDDALLAWSDALELARSFSRDLLLRVLAPGASVLAPLDEGETLWRVYQAIQEVDGWWAAD